MAFVPSVRPPTGIPAAPLILVSGVPKSGKSLTAYKIGLSPRIDTTYVLDLGEGTADEYAAAAPYQVVEWGTSWSDLADSVRWCCNQRPSDPDRLTAVVIDSGSEVWEGLKSRATSRAKSSRKNRDALQRDPDAEIDVSMNYWNDAANTWASIVNPLRTASHVVGIILVRSEEVAEVVNGAPTRNRITSLQAHKSLPAVVTAHVKVSADHVARLVEVRSLNVQVPPSGLELDGANPLGHLLDLVAIGSGAFASPVVRAPEDLERDDPDRDDWWKELNARYRALPDGTKDRARELLILAGLVDEQSRRPLTPFSREQLTVFSAICDRAERETSQPPEPVDAPLPPDPEEAVAR